MKRLEEMYSLDSEEDIEPISEKESESTSSVPDSIPIEFIRNEITSFIEVVHDGDYDYNYASCLLQLLERWEKENELNR